MKWKARNEIVLTYGVNIDLAAVDRTSSVV